VRDLLAKIAAGETLRPNGKGGYALDGQDVDRGHAFALAARRWIVFRAGAFHVTEAGQAILQATERKAA